MVRRRWARRTGWAIWRLGPSFAVPDEWYVDTAWTSELTDRGVYSERAQAEAIAAALTSRCTTIRVARGAAAGQGTWRPTHY